MTELTTTREQAIRARLNSYREAAARNDPPAYAEARMIMEANAKPDIEDLLAELDRLRGERQRLANETKHPAWANITDDMVDDAIERMARGLSEHWRDMHTNEALGQQRMLARAVLNALLDSEQGGTR